MATNKHAQIRYNILDHCFRNSGKSYTIEDLLEACNHAITEFDPKVNGIKRRQLFDDIRYMESSQGWSIELKDGMKKGRMRVYRYLDSKFSISNQPLNEDDANQLKTAIFALSRLQNQWADELSVRLREQFKMADDPRKIIEFEENEFLKGKEYISELYNAILYKKVLRIAYQSFKSGEPQIFVLHPYYLKQYNNRWFLFGQDERYATLSNLALDRIKYIVETDNTYMETTTDFKDHFEEVVGVTVPDSPVEKIVLRVKGNTIKYIETKAIHGSQKIKVKDENISLVELMLIPNYELESVILSYGEDMKVISPNSLKEKIESRIALNLENYRNSAE